MFRAPKNHELKKSINEKYKAELLAQLIKETKDLKKSTSTTKSLDPFNLLEIKSAKNEKPKNLNELIHSKHNLSEPAEIKKNPLPLPSHTIPQHIHFIWLGSVLPQDKRKLIENWKKQNPDYHVCLWINHDVVDLNGFKEYKEWANETGINLIDSEAVFSGHIKLEKEFRLALFRPNYGGASDILRLYILQSYFGIYCDTDIHCNSGLGIIHAKNDYLISRYQKIETDYHEKFQSGFTNSIIAMAPKNQLIDHWIGLLENQYVKKYSEILKIVISVFSDQGGYCYRDSELNQITDVEILRELTMAESGPSLEDSLFEYISTLNVDQDSDDTRVIREKISDYGEISWLQPKNLSIQAKSEIELITKMITTVLHELEREPRMLFLYKNQDYNLYGDIILQYLIKFYPEKVKNVMIVHMGPESTTVEAWNILTKTEHFPALQHNLNLKSYIPVLLRYPNSKLFDFLCEIEKDIPVIYIPSLTLSIAGAFFNLNEKIKFIYSLFDKNIIETHHLSGVDSIVSIATRERQYEVLNAYLDEEKLCTAENLQIVLTICSGKYVRSEEEFNERLAIFKKALSKLKFLEKTDTSTSIYQDVFSDTNDTLLHIAARGGKSNVGHNLPMIKYLIDELHLAINAENNYKKTPFDYFIQCYVSDYEKMTPKAKKSYQQVLDYFSSKKARYTVNLFELICGNEETRNFELIEELVKKLKINLNTLRKSEFSSRSLIESALRKRDIPLVKFLLKNNIQLNEVYGNQSITEYLKSEINELSAKLTKLKSTIDSHSVETKQDTLSMDYGISFHSYARDNSEYEQEKMQNDLSILKEIDSLLEDHLKKSENKSTPHDEHLEPKKSSPSSVSDHSLFSSSGDTKTEDIDYEFAFTFTVDSKNENPSLLDTENAADLSLNATELLKEFKSEVNEIKSIIDKSKKNTSQDIPERINAAKVCIEGLKRGLVTTQRQASSHEQNINKQNINQCDLLIQQLDNLYEKLQPSQSSTSTPKPKKSKS